MFIYEVKSLLFSLKQSISEENLSENVRNSQQIAKILKKIDDFIEKSMREVMIENEVFAENLEKMNIEDLPKKEDEKMLREMKVLHVQLREIKEIKDDLLRKNEKLRLENEILLNFNKNGDNNTSNGLQKTVKKLIKLEKESHENEIMIESMKKQILLLKDENLKLFVILLFFFGKINYF